MRWGERRMGRTVWTVLGALAMAAAASACGGDKQGAEGDATADAPDPGEGGPGPDAIDPDAIDPDAIDPDAGDGPDTPAPIFAHGCPEPNLAMALPITHPEFRVEGPSGLGGPGDYLLANDRAAFVIHGASGIKTYWHYGGSVIDAVAVEGCAQAGPEQFDELALLLGTFSAAPFSDSVLRGFRADEVSVLADGSDGGPAVVRAVGSDDFFWLLELELMRMGWVGTGVPKPFSLPYGLEVTVDYVLHPGSPVLEIEMHIENLERAPAFVLSAAGIWFGDTTASRFYVRSKSNIGGFGVDTGLAWLSAEGFASDGAVAVTKHGASLATVNISGVRGLFDLIEVLSAPAVGARATRTDRFALAVGPTDSNSAVAALVESDPERVGDLPLTLAPLAGQVVDEDGAPLAGARVRLEVPATGGGWVHVDGFATDAIGTFAGRAPLFAGGGEQARLVFEAPGRAPIAEGPFVGLPSEPVQVQMGPASALAYEVRDASGALIPASLQVFAEGQRRVRHDSATGQGQLPLPPGTYTLSVTRGFEYSTFAAPLTITEGAIAPLQVQLTRVVDTTGYLSVDSHVHAEHSPDSPVLGADRFANAAAEGLEVIVHTDHEIVRSYEAERQASGAAAWVASVIGQEVTAPVPEHINAYPFVPDDDHPRGRPVDWLDPYLLDYDELLHACRERTGGGGVVVLNHPRGSSCNYLCLLGWDRERAEPTLEDPTVLGLREDAALWSWNFDAMELMNGAEAVLLDPAKPDRSGLLDDWMSFLNHGHLVTATGVSDVHGVDAPGSPRNYFASGTDDPAAFVEQELIDAMRSGRVIVSLGAFAHVWANESATVGDLLTAEDGEVSLHVRVQAPETIDVTHAMVLANCDLVAWLPATDPHGVDKLDETLELTLDADTHLVVLAFGAEPLPMGLKQFDPAGVPRVVTNPIYIDVDGNGAFDPPGAKTCTYLPAETVE